MGEHQWAEFTHLSRNSADTVANLILSVSEFAQASKTERTSAKFGAHVFEMALYNLMRRGSNGDVFRFMNRPTNEALFDPWLRVLDRLGVQQTLGS